MSGLDRYTLEAAAAVAEEHEDDMGHGKGAKIAAAIRALIPEDREDALMYATRLLVGIVEQHYPDRVPEWRPLPDLVGVLTQIDNAVSGLSRAAPSTGSRR